MICDQPNSFISSIFENAALLLSEGLRNAEPKDQAYFRTALAAYQRISDAMLKHVTKPKED